MISHFFSRGVASSRLSRWLMMVALAAMVAFVLPAMAQEAEAVHHATEAASHSTENPFIPLMLALAIIILASRLGGALSRLINQPRVFGQLIIGVILGPTLLDFLHWPVFGGIELQATIDELAELGVLLLMFNIGLEVHVSELLKVGKIAAFAGVLGALIPVVFGGALVLLAGFSWQVALFAGVTLAATSVSISAQVLLELDVLQTREGNALLATALVDDVLALLLVSLAIAFTVQSGAGVDLGGLAIIVLRMLAYIIGGFAVAWFILPRILRRVIAIPALSQSYGIPAAALVVALLFGWSAEFLGGVAAITGAFIAGVGVSRLDDINARHDIESTVSGIAYTFLVPIFFVDVGLQTDLSQFTLAAVPFAAALLLVAALTKMFGAGLGGLLGGFDRDQSLRLGVCMISRGEVGLIIASLGLTAGVFDPDSALFASLFLVILLTTVMTPPLVRRVFPRKAVTTTA